jgi:hypothetical protein
VLTNSALVAASAVGAETLVKYVSPYIIHQKATGTNGLAMMGSEAALSGLIYSQIFPRFYGNAVPMQQLVVIAGSADLGAQIAGPRLAAFADSSQQSY